MTDFEPPLRLILDGEALASNWKALNARSGSAQAGAAVKANGYGLGARYLTAIGPIRLDVGLPAQGATGPKVYLGIGQAF